jgi:uncharacterized protein
MKREGGAKRIPWPRAVVAGLGWLAFGLGWAGVFLPGLPTTIFWILAALAFVRTNRRMYDRIVSNPRFGPGIRQFIEKGRISRRGKVVSIAAMLLCAALGLAAIPPVWLRILVAAAALAGSAWVLALPLAGASDGGAAGGLPAPRRADGAVGDEQEGGAHQDGDGDDVSRGAHAAPPIREPT